MVSNRAPMREFCRHGMAAKLVPMPLPSFVLRPTYITSMNSAGVRNALPILKDNGAGGSMLGCDSCAEVAGGEGTLNAGERDGAGKGEKLPMLLLLSRWRPPDGLDFASCCPSAA